VTSGVKLAKLMSHMSPAKKAASLAAFTTDPAVGVLLMDAVGAVGLDLSFVSYVFLMEPIKDRSLEEQV
jgi:SNF2 family DNA or RNA helicase